MYERSYGYKYEELGGEYRSAADIAKLIRADIKLAIKEGVLPGSARNYSVRSQSYSGGQSIDVTLVGLEGAWIAQDDSKCVGYSYCNVNCGLHERQCPAAEHLSDEAAAAVVTLERIHGAYNYDGSESQVDYFDVNYYGIVSVESAWAAERRAAAKAAKVA